MRIFITGGTGLTGPLVISRLIEAGHEVTGLARSDASAEILEGLGAAVRRGSLEDVNSMRGGAEDADGVIHMAFTNEFADADRLEELDREAILALGTPLQGTDRPLVITSGTAVTALGRVSSETEPPDPDSVAYFRIAGEEACFSCVPQGVRSSVVRLAPSVHGPGDRYGFIPIHIAATREKGFSAYIGDGNNRWPAVHRFDVGRLFQLALEEAPAGTVLHGAAEGGVRFGDIAEEIGAQLGVPVKSLTPAEAAEHFGNPFFAKAFAADAPVSNETTRELGWNPTHPTLLEDLKEGEYFTTSDS